MQKFFTDSLFKMHKEDSLSGRYIYPLSIASIIQDLSFPYTVERIGKSVRGQDIYSIKIGTGKVKIMMWSQMHGNESTTTKALFDLLNVFSESSSLEISTILTSCTILIIPMLNPDGADDYTRINANGIDLNRDAKTLSQPESVALRNVFESFKPNYCFNLHGRRTIFSAGKMPRPATISFLAPAQDKKASITLNRSKAMSIIVGMDNSLQKLIPDSIGIYDDSFNINCVGDYFQSRGVPTVLFEAGHYKEDYDREYVRYLIFHSLMVAIWSVATKSYAKCDSAKYLNIPENNKLFYDIILRNALIVKSKKLELYDVAIQYEERLINRSICFSPKVENILQRCEYFGHKEIDANGHRLLTQENREISIGYANDFVLLNNQLLSLKT